MMIAIVSFSLTILAAVSEFLQVFGMWVVFLEPGSLWNGSGGSFALRCL